MAYEIKRSKQFLSNALHILSFIEKEWGIQSAVKFHKILESKIETLSANPKIGRVVLKSKNLRKLIITKHNKLYYRIRKNEIHILFSAYLRQSKIPNVISMNKPDSN